ncbi:MAG: amidohydrolase [Synergistales bacterium]|nr:amidohydrolase [Synergistales bacterium]
MNEKSRAFLQRALSKEEKIISWRRDFHKHPELGFEENRTSSIIAEALEQMGYEVSGGIGITGVVATLTGEREGPSRALRADMDALPMKEETGLPYASVHHGIMHACCHDGHMAMLLGAAEIIAECRQDLRGKIALVFQPGEEGFAGAKKMLEEGFLEKYPLDFMFGHHIMPVILPHKSLTTRKNAFTANSDRFYIDIQGRGGHASIPHLVKDPIPALGQMIGAINSLVSRNIDPFEEVVVSIGQVHAGSSENIIPDSALVTGSVRTFTDLSQELVHKRLEEICEGIGQAYGLGTSFEYRYNYRSVMNDPDLTGQLIELGLEFCDDVIEREHPFTGSEDFSFFSREIPSCFVMIGAEGTEGVHNPKMTFDESILSWGAAWQAYLAIRSGDEWFKNFRG